jgi:hypothetical protein
MSKDYILSIIEPQIKTKEEFFNFLQEYNYNNDLSLDTNIEELAKVLVYILSYSNIKEIELTGGYLTPQLYSDNRNLSQWKLCALFNCLKENNTIEIVNIENQVLNSHDGLNLSNKPALALREALTVNKSIYDITIHNSVDSVIEIIIKGIKASKSIRCLNLTGDLEDIVPSIMEMLEYNTNIVHARVDAAITDQESIELLARVIKNNQTLTAFYTNTYRDVFLRLDYDPIMEAFKININLTTFVFESRGDDDYIASSGYYEKIKHLLIYNHVLTTIPDIYEIDADQFHDYKPEAAKEVDDLLKRNEARINDLVSRVKEMDLSKPDFSKDSIKLITDLDTTIGRSLLTQALKGKWALDDSDRAGDRENEYIQDREKEKNILSFIKIYENYYDKNFFHFSLVAKNIGNAYLGYDYSPFWKQVASYLKFSDISHEPTSLIGEDQHHDD